MHVNKVCLEKSACGQSPILFGNAIQELSSRDSDMSGSGEEIHQKATKINPVYLASSSK